VLVAARRRRVAPNRREWLLTILGGLTWFAVWSPPSLRVGSTAMLVGVGRRRADLPGRGADGPGVPHLGLRAARMDAGRLGVTTYLVPPITIVKSALPLAEWPPPAVWCAWWGVTRRSAGSRRRAPAADDDQSSTRAFSPPS
jgi:hypothetical protein